MNASKALLEMLKGYQVEYVFGLPGETTLPLYKEWLGYPEIRHVMARDERSAAFMADGYARFSGKPGVCEAPSVGATHVLPGVAEAYKSSLPMVMLISDVPLHLEKRSILTGLDQTSMFTGITKETLTITDPSSIPHAVRRAFRVATTGRPGPVHLHLPSDILASEAEYSRMYVQPDFAFYPGHRSIAQPDKIIQALKLLGSAERPVMVCGQGALYSQAWDEVVQLAELFAAPVGTTINGKGCMPEGHPLSIGVIGARGGTSVSNSVLSNADLVFFVGSSTDSTGTNRWTMPPEDSGARFIHLNVCEHEAANNYRGDVILIGDAKATLVWMLELADTAPKDWSKLPRIKAIDEEKKQQADYVADLMGSGDIPVHPLRFIKELSEALPRDRCLIMDVGSAAIYTSAYYRVPEAGRSMAYNFAMGSLGYAIPASIGVAHARPHSCLATIVGDGSFGMTAGELETMARIAQNNNVILIDNLSYGWIRAEWRLNYGAEYVDWATNFREVDYLKIAEGFGLKAKRVEKPDELGPILRECFSDPEPTFIDLVMQPEDKLVPPVPNWVKRAKEIGVRHIE